MGKVFSPLYCTKIQILSRLFYLHHCIGLFLFSGKFLENTPYLFIGTFFCILNQLFWRICKMFKNKYSPLPYISDWFLNLAKYFYHHHIFLTNFEFSQIFLFLTILLHVFCVLAEIFLEKRKSPHLRWTEERTFIVGITQDKQKKHRRNKYRLPLFLSSYGAWVVNKYCSAYALQSY